MEKKKERSIFREHKITTSRRVVQIVSFLLINYIILDFLFFQALNFSLLDEILKVLPILNTPRNPLSTGGGFIEYFYRFIGDGKFPFLLIGAMLLVYLFTNRFFCGWICPIGTIQDSLYSIPTPRKWNPKYDTHKWLIKLKYFIVILLLLFIVPLGFSKINDIEFYFQYKENLGALSEKPESFFSLSEYIFVYLPNLFASIWNNGDFTLEPLNPFKGWPPTLQNFDILPLFIFLFYLIILLVAVWCPRVYCRYFCPLGACAAVISNFSFLKLERSPVKCVGRTECGICERVCPKQIKILDEPFEFFTGSGECNLCLKCKEECPYKAITFKFG